MARKPKTKPDDSLDAPGPVFPEREAQPTRTEASLAIEYLPVGDLVPYAGNSRKHSPDQIAAIAGSIRRFGFVNPVLIDAEGTIVAGHARVMAARQAGLQKIPTIRLGHLSDAERRAYVIADNRLAELATWDTDTLRAEVDQLLSEGVGLDLLGFDEQALTKLVGSLTPGGGLTDEDDVPAEPTVPVSRLGDLWVLGRHRLICGDSTKADDVARVLNGVTPHLMVTDPPYGVKYDPAWRGEAKTSDGERVSLGVHATGKVLNDDRADWREAWALFPGDVVYVWHAGLFAGVVAESLEASGFSLRSQIIWAKTNFAIGRGDYHWHHEPCWYAVRKGKAGHFNGDRKQHTLWTISKPAKSETGHGTQKPVECMRKPIENNSSPGQAIYEPFCGSGTTIIAAEQTGRACHAVELNPVYIDVIVRRWQEFTGQEATLEGDGRTFGQVADERRGLTDEKAA